MSDWWYPGQLARQDEYDGLVPPDERGLQPPQDAFEVAAARVRAPYRNLPAPGSNRIGQLAEQVTSMPSWADVATQQMNKDKEAFQSGGIGSLLADTSVAQELAGGFGGTTKEVKPVMGALAEVAPPFYSAAGRAVENAKLGKGTGEQWLGYLRNQPGVKPEELQHVFGNLPEGQLTKAQMQAHAAENAVTLGETRIGGAHSLEDYNTAAMGRYGRPFDQLTDAETAVIDKSFQRNTKWHDYQLPGGENYRETLLTLPSEMPKEMIAARDNVTRLERQTTDQMAEWKALAESRPPGDPETLAAYQRLANSRRELGAADELAGRLSNQRADATFKSSHWDEPNVLAHVRTNDREIPGVGKSLHVEEIQSDWHQKGRTSGYESDRKALLDEVIAKEKASIVAHQLNMPEAEKASRLAAYNEANSRLEKFEAAGKAVPDAPFKSTWADVALKRQIREAAEKGYDAISWTPGKAQAARYPDALRQAVSNISWSSPGAGGRANPDGLRYVHAQPNGGGTDLVFTINKDGAITEASSAAAKGKHVEDIFGKDMAKQIMGEAEGDIASKDFVIGAKGMEGFYDKMLVDKANALGKKHGARVEQSEVSGHQYKGYQSYHEGEGPTGEPAVFGVDSTGASRLIRQNFRNYEEAIEAAAELNKGGKKEPVHVLRITPELRAAAMKGFPLFTAGGIVAGGTIGELARQDKYGRNE